MKIVAVTQRVDVYPDRNERRDALDQRLCGWLGSAGYLPVPVPNTLDLSSSGEPALRDWLRAIGPGAIVLSGGNDIGDIPERDGTERYLLEHAKQHGLPALGICRGMQMMAVWANGRLVTVGGHVGSRHSLRLTEPGWPGEVNSYHNLALADCPAGFVVTARAEDGSIEAVRHEHLLWEGWMWHPEREQDFQLQDIQRLKALFGA